jgi:hypothetical protein
MLLVENAPLASRVKMGQRRAYRMDEDSRIHEALAMM